jgi:hypothetical protein
MENPTKLSEFAGVHELPAQRYFNVLCMPMVRIQTCSQTRSRTGTFRKCGPRPAGTSIYGSNMLSVRSLILISTKWLMERVKPKSLLAFELE